MPPAPGLKTSLVVMTGSCYCPYRQKPGIPGMQPNILTCIGQPLTAENHAAQNVSTA
jgi:hypothetical protein